MINKIFSRIDLHQGEEDKEKVLEYVISNISFKGANIWILSCAIVIASIGLNVNSTAVIIGAMLISPLMGPIVGAGFSLAIFDFELLKKSGKNLFLATIVSLLVATLYFYISPFKETQSELLARTSPNIYDVLIAFFGGLVGVIAITRVEKGNPIPGVAIATALMPPLCTAGYGLAIGNWKFFAGALFLYSINCVFIGISTFMIAKYLKYPAKKHVDERVHQKIQILITFIILVFILPSIYLAYDLLNEKKFHEKADAFIESEFGNKGFTIVYKKINYKANPKVIELAFLNQKVEPEEIKSLHKKVSEYGLQNTKLDIKQNIKDIKKEILNELGSQNKSISEKDILILKLQKELDTFKWHKSTLYNELKILYPQFTEVALGKMINNQSQTQYYLIYNSPQALPKEEAVKITKWLSEKLSISNILLLHTPTIVP